MFIYGSHKAGDTNENVRLSQALWKNPRRAAGKTVICGFIRDLSLNLRLQNLQNIGSCSWDLEWNGMLTKAKGVA